MKFNIYKRKKLKYFNLPIFVKIIYEHAPPVVSIKLDKNY